MKLKTSIIGLLLGLIAGCGGIDGLDDPDRRGLERRVLGGATIAVDLDDSSALQGRVETVATAANVVGVVQRQEPALVASDQPCQLGGACARAPRALQAGLEQLCTHNGSTYQPGQIFAAGDDCNSCICEDGGRVTCTLMDCR